MTQQEIVCRQSLTCRCEQTVVPHAVAEEQEVARHVSLCCGAVVEHLQVTAVGVGIGCAASKLVVQLIGGHDVHAQSVALTVEVGQSLCLLEQLLAGRYYYDHVGLRVGMMVLVRYVIDILGRFHPRRERRHRQRLVPCDLHKVEVHVGTSQVLQRYDVVVLEVCRREGEGLLTTFAVLRIGGALAHDGDGHYALRLIVEQHLHLGSCRRCGRDGERGLCGVGVAAKLYLLRLSRTHGLGVEEVTSALHPRKAVGLMKRVIIIR